MDTSFFKGRTAMRVCVIDRLIGWTNRISAKSTRSEGNHYDLFHNKVYAMDGWMDGWMDGSYQYTYNQMSNRVIEGFDVCVCVCVSLCVCTQAPLLFLNSKQINMMGKWQNKIK